jgi:putative oxidoreductase
LASLPDGRRSLRLAKWPSPYFLAHAPKSFYPAVNGGNLAVLYCFVFLYLVFAGGGPWSVDHAVLKRD